MQRDGWVDFNKAINVFLRIDLLKKRRELNKVMSGTFYENKIGKAKL